MFGCHQKIIRTQTTHNDPRKGEHGGINHFQRVGDERHKGKSKDVSENGEDGVPRQPGGEREGMKLSAEKEVIALLKEIRDLNLRQFEMLEKEKLKVDNAYVLERADKESIEFTEYIGLAQDLSAFTDDLTAEAKHYLALVVWLASGGINLLKLEEESSENILGSNREIITNILTRRYPKSGSRHKIATLNGPDGCLHFPGSSDLGTWNGTIFRTLWYNFERGLGNYGTEMFMRLNLEGFKDIPWPSSRRNSRDIALLTAKVWAAAFRSAEDYNCSGYYNENLSAASHPTTIRADIPKQRGTQHVCEGIVTNNTGPLPILHYFNCRKQFLDCWIVLEVPRINFATRQWL